MGAYLHLRALGLTEYESKAYVAMLLLGPTVPSRIARQAGIPRPKIYETLERLEGRGLAQKTQTSPIGYVPLSAQEYIERSKREFFGRMEALERDLARLTADTTPQAIHSLVGEKAILALSQSIVENAKHTLHIAGDQMEGFLHRIPRSVTLVHLPSNRFPHGFWPSVSSLLLARDGETALIAHFEAEPHGVHTHNTEFVALIENHICLALTPDAQNP